MPFGCLKMLELSSSFDLIRWRKLNMFVVVLGDFDSYKERSTLRVTVYSTQIGLELLLKTCND